MGRLWLGGKPNNPNHIPRLSDVYPFRCVDYIVAQEDFHAVTPIIGGVSSEVEAIQKPFNSFALGAASGIAQHPTLHNGVANVTVDGGNPGNYAGFRSQSLFETYGLAGVAYKGPWLITARMAFPNNNADVDCTFGFKSALTGRGVWFSIRGNGVIQVKTVNADGNSEQVTDTVYNIATLGGNFNRYSIEYVGLNSSELITLSFNNVIVARLNSTRFPTASNLAKMICHFGRGSANTTAYSAQVDYIDFVQKPTALR